jgi:hypothetical protein
MKVVMVVVVIMVVIMSEPDYMRLESSGDV